MAENVTVFRVSVKDFTFPVAKILVMFLELYI